MADAWFIVRNLLKVAVLFCLAMLMLVGAIGLAAGIGWLVGREDGAVWAIVLALVVWIAPLIAEKVLAPFASIVFIGKAIVDAWSGRATRSRK